MVKQLLYGCHLGLMRPKHIGPSIFALSKKKWDVKLTLHQNSWVDQIDTSGGLTSDCIDVFTSFGRLSSLGAEED